MGRDRRLQVRTAFSGDPRARDGPVSITLHLNFHTLRSGINGLFGSRTGVVDNSVDDHRPALVARREPAAAQSPWRYEDTMLIKGLDYAMW